MNIPTREKLSACSPHRKGNFGQGMNSLVHSKYQLQAPISSTFVTPCCCACSPVPKRPVTQESSISFSPAIHSPQVGRATSPRSITARLVFANGQSRAEAHKQRDETATHLLRKPSQQNPAARRSLSLEAHQHLLGEEMKTCCNGEDSPRQGITSTVLLLQRRSTSEHPSPVQAATKDHTRNSH